MNVRRAAVVAVAVWLAVVVVGSTMVWAVISRAGREVITVTDAPRSTTAGQGLRQHSSAAGSAHPTPRPGHHFQRPSGTASEPAATESPGDGPSSPSGTGSGHGGSPGPGHPGGSHPGAGQTSAPPGPAAVRDTWSGRGGSVMLECTGQKITEMSAYPDAGYRYKVEDKTATSLEVTFISSDDEHEVEVKAYCQGGSPHFRVDGGDDEHDD